MSDLDTIRERHNAGHFCVVNGRTLWVVPADLPCDTRVVLDALGYCAEARDVQQRAHGAARADADRLAEALREHTRYLNDENDDPLLEGHSIGCRIIQRPTDDNNHTTGSQHVGDCAANHRHLVEALRQHDDLEAPTDD